MAEQAILSQIIKDVSTLPLKACTATPPVSNYGCAIVPKHFFKQEV